MVKKIIILTLLVAAGAGAFMYYEKQSALLNKFQVDLSSYTVTNFSLSTMNLVLTFKVTSYNSIEGQITSSNIDIYINDNYVGTANNTTPQTIPAQGYNYVQINLQADVSQLATDAVSILAQSATAPVNIRMVGTVTIKVGWISITLPVDDTETTTIQSLITS